MTAQQPTEGDTRQFWFLRYDRTDVLPDMVTGLTVAALMVPQSMAYATAAGFPAVLGLYSCVVPLLVYALLGRSPVLAIGPIISINLVAATGITRVAEPGTAEFATVAATVTLLIGIMHLAAWAAKLPRLAVYITKSALDGFLLAVAVVVVISQLDALLGLTDQHLDPLETLRSVVAELDETRIMGLAIGLATMALLLATKRFAKFPAALVSVVLATGAMWVFSPSSDQVRLIGSVAGGLPWPSMPSLGHIVPLLPTAAACTLLAAIEVNALERRFGRGGAAPASETATLGLSNLSASAFGGLPVTGVPTRTAVAHAAGARTQATGLVAALAALGVLAVGTAALAYLPEATLAAVAIVAALAFFRLPTWRGYWHDDRRAFVTGMAVCVAAVLLGFEVGAVAVVVASAVDHIGTRGRGAEGSA